VSQSIEAARIALRQRQGGGARYDAENAPARELDWVRRGTAYFARLVNDLPDSALDEPSMVAGFTRRRLIAYVGYHARLISELIAWTRTNAERSFPRIAQVSAEDLEFGLTQPSRALRYLFDHSQIHLNVEWRDLTDAGWDRSVVDVAGRVIPLRGTATLRAEVIWLHAVDLDAGGRFIDMPSDFLDWLIRHYAARGLGSDIVLSACDRAEPFLPNHQAGLCITGRAADIARWLSGRGTGNLESADGPLPIIGPPSLAGLGA